MGFYERIDARGVRETGRPVSFVPKGALTHPPAGEVVFPTETVRSARRMRLLRKPYGQCHITAMLLSLSTQSAQCSASYAQQGDGDLPPPSRLPAQICHRQFYRSYGYCSCDTHFLFAKKKQKPKTRGR